MFLFCAVGITVFGQVTQVVNPYPKTITVTGSAEMDIVPDEIYVQIQLSEYEKKGTGKVNLETIRRSFFETCRALGIADSLISVDAYQANNLPYWLQKKKKMPDMMASVNYLVKFQNVKKLDDLIEGLDDQATTQFFIAKTSHSKIEVYRRQLKIEAVKAAREKAVYLTESIAEKVGVAVSIEEPQDYSVVPLMQKNNVQNYIVQANAGGNNDSGVDFTKIKLQYKVNAVFALQ